MADPRSPDDPPHDPQRRRFETTRWSLVLAAGGGGSADSRAALATLCADYWYPLYAYVRRRVADSHAAHDLIQEFFARLLERDVLATADPRRGRFRSFLLTSLQHFLTNQWDRSQAQKRGGGRAIIPLDIRHGEARYALEPADRQTAERLFERQWAETLLDRVMDQLRAEFTRGGKQQQFEQLKSFLTGRNAGVSYAEAARQLQMSEGAAMVASHRMRRRYRELLRAEIAQTVADPDEVEDEIRRLFVSLGP
jgi:RNA polymerase sigma-70 factor (ECF subfamily)